MVGSDSKLNSLLSRGKLEGNDVVFCKGFSNEDAIKGKLVSLTSQDNSVVLRANLGDGSILESSIPRENLEIVERKKEIQLQDDFVNRGPVWHLGL